jgi:hypothetical protein
MKKTVFLVIMFGLMLGLSGCGKKDNKRTGISDRQVRDAVADPAPAEDHQTTDGGTKVSRSGYVYGQIYASGTETEFDRNVRGFTSASIDPWGDPQNNVTPELGLVSGQLNQNTGVWIRGDAHVQGGVFDPTGATKRNLDLSKTSIRLIIWDSYAGQTDASGQVIPEYGVSFANAKSGSFINYASKTAVIIFEDDYGWVKFSGKFDANYFQGDVTYYNNDYVRSILAPNDGAWDGSLGKFYISTCGFFYCE